eukprot:TRINITY_DN7983_c0_g1_i5.p1 TRINITY_DN7983_c0_g1~~TRINITY_DN7983_c0_g1_i5.p1  ORF type:complete len:247 (+),score=71.32 TRINITY_DN7983_c0_g1_i5:144-884(+)
MSELDETRTQLAQVQAALVSDPGNAELVELATNLKAMIEIQQQLAGKVDAPVSTTQSGAVTRVGDWFVGQECEAVWSEDGKYYTAIITKFSSDGTQAYVTYPEYDEEDVVKLASLRPLRGLNQGLNPKAQSAQNNEATAIAGDAHKAKKKKSWEMRKKQEEKRKAQQQEIEKVLEKKKGNWQNFAKKNKKAKKKGVGGSGRNGASIFATPESFGGKVGVGTCGIGGKGMTTFKDRGKWHFDKDEDN